MKRLAGVVALIALGLFALIWAALEIQDALLHGDGVNAELDTPWGDC